MPPMTPYEIISVVISLIALIVAVFSYLKVTSLSMGNIELYINERITNTKERVSDISMQMAPLLAKKSRSEEEEAQHQIYVRNLRTAIENNLNAYEEACAKYRDNKVDRKRFVKNYRTEIRQLVENKHHKKYFDGVTSRYKAILEVYSEWENLEK